MKRPKSPGLLEGGLPPSGQQEEVEEERSLRGESKPKRERRHGSVTLCEVCNIQLNSSAQAQIHYNGKTHQRRLRKYSLAKAAANTHTGTLSQVNPLLASLSLPGRPLLSLPGRPLQPLPGRPLQPLQPQLHLEHFLPLRVSGSTPLSLFPNFNTMDPVQKAVINHTFGVAQPKKKQIISCNICHLRFNSTNQAEAHYKGHKHARKLKAMDVQRNRHRSQASHTERERERERGKKGVSMSETLPALMDTNLTDGIGLFSSPPAVRLRLEDSQGPSPSPSPTPVSETSSLDASVLLSPQVSPASQLSDLLSDSGAVEGPSPGPGPGPGPDPDPLEPLMGQGEPPGPEEEVPTEAKSPATDLHCPMCKITVNSSSQLVAHYSGSKHKLMLEGQAGGSTRRRGGKVLSSPRVTCRTKQPISSKSGVAAANQLFHCKVCEVSVNSETQLKQHMSSKRHKDRLAGRPPKPKFSPYTKIQPNPVLASVRWSGFPFGGVTSAMGKLASHFSTFSPQTKLALQKQLSKTFPAGFLAGHLNPAALCTMATNPLSLRHPPGPHAAIIQTPLLSPALFRPAPGPLRATHAPFIFSPY